MTHRVESTHVDLSGGTGVWGPGDPEGIFGLFTSSFWWCFTIYTDRYQYITIKATAYTVKAALPLRSNSIALYISAGEAPDTKT